MSHDATKYSPMKLINFCIFCPRLRRDDCDADECEDDDDGAEVDRLCLNDNDDLIQSYFRKPSGYGVATAQLEIEAAGPIDPHHNK